MVDTDEQWREVDEGWGRRAADMATLHEPSNAREYVALHRLLDVGAGVQLLDVACGAGLAVELAAAAGARCSGIDASHRLVDVALDRTPDADIRVGDMRSLPWPEASFDVVTSFRGIWGTTPEVLDEVLRVLRPGGRFGMTVWGHIKASTGAWALRPFSWASPSAVGHQAAMNTLGRPGVGEALLTEHGFVDVERVRVPFAWEFTDAASYARTLAATGPAFEAIQSLGEERFLLDATRVAEEHLRAGLPLRAQIEVVGFVGRRPVTVPTRPARGISFLTEPDEPSPAAVALFDEDRAEVGFVMNASRVWAHQPEALTELFDLLGRTARAAGLGFRDRGVLVTAMATTLGDSYCALAWGGKLAGVAGAELSAAVLTGQDTGLDERERTLATWARRIVADPNATTVADVEALREVGFDDRQIHALTTFVALRLAFSTVNDALGALPDAQLRESLPPEVVTAVLEASRGGRPIA